MPFWQKIRQHTISYFTKLRNKTIKKHIEHQHLKKQFCTLLNGLHHNLWFALKYIYNSYIAGVEMEQAEPKLLSLA